MTASLPSYLEKQASLYRLERARSQSGLDASSLPTPYPLQQAILDSPATFKCVACGRQVGKTTLAAYVADEGLRAGKRTFYISPSLNQTDQFWEYVTEYTRTLPGLYKNESRRLLRLPNGGKVLTHTGRDPDALRSGHWDTLIFDECAFMKAEVWHSAGLPMLLRTNGQAWFFSTPQRRNWFFELFVNAQADTSGDWQAWNFPTTENPHLPQEALARLTENMTDESYRQEILAEFLEGEGAVFRHVSERCTLPRRQPYEGSFVAGVDWAQSKDYTAIVVMDVATREVVDYDRFNGVDWALQRGRLASMHQRWKLNVIWAESNSIGSPNIEALQREGLPVRSFETTAVSKPPLIESLVLAFDRGEIGVLDDPIIKGELMAYERKVTSTGRSQYSAPEGMHDDTVIALALAWHGATHYASSPIAIVELDPLPSLWSMNDTRG